jgi:hypothetical protein
VRPVRRAAGSEGDTNFRVTSVADPKAASSALFEGHMPRGSQASRAQSRRSSRESRT